MRAVGSDRTRTRSEPEEFAMSKRRDAQRAAQEAKRRAVERIDRDMNEQAAALDRDFERALEEWAHHQEDHRRTGSD
jgi:hypothetical protein